MFKNKNTSRLLSLLLIGCIAVTGCSKTSGGTSKQSKTVAADKLAASVKENYGNAENSKYEYGDPIMDIARDKTFDYEIGFDAEASGMESFSEIFGLYQDAGFTKKINYKAGWTDDANQKFRIAPPSSAPGAISTVGLDEKAPGFTKDSYNLFDKDEYTDWGNIGKMYQVQYVDLKTGEKLEKPIVTVITVKGELNAPRIKFQVTEEGIASFSWDEVEGADKYYIVEANNQGDYATNTVMVIGETKKTTWTDTPDEDDSFDGNVFKANNKFRTYRISEDDWYNQSMVDAYGTEFNPADGAVRESAESVNSYGVIAVSDKGTSMLSNLYVEDDLAKLLPSSLAYEIYRNGEEDFSQYASSISMMPSYRYVVMSDGHLSQQLLTYDIKNAKETTGQYIEYNEDETEIVKTEKRPVLKVPYTIDNTPFTGSIIVETYDTKTMDKELEALKERQDSLRSKTGDVDKELTTQEEQEKEEKKESEDIAATEDKITASSPLSAYLAINMIAGQETVDLSGFPESADQEYLVDAWMEAMYQNPIAIGVETAYLSPDGKMMSMVYQDEPEDRLKKQEAIRQEVSKVTKEIVKDNMTDLEKEVAINQYLCDSGTYDNAALENAEKYDFKKVDPEFNDSFTPYGILVNKVGVCASYASSFKLLADAAGLDSVVVTGYLEGSVSHAWNRVYVEGAWQTVDATNNDNEMMYNALFNIPDSASAMTLVEDERFMENSQLSIYASNVTDQEYYRLCQKYYSEDQIADALIAGLEKSDSVSLRTDYDLDDEAFNKIGAKVIEATGDTNLKGTYWLGVIYLEK